MSVYTVHASSDRMWHILKDGTVFMVTHSRLAAERMVGALNQGLTPTPGEYTVAQVECDLPDRDHKPLPPRAPRERSAFTRLWSRVERV